VILKNRVLELLRGGDCALGVALRQARTVEIAAAMSASGFDWLFLDLEHGSMSLDAAAQIACAALHVGITPVVRVAGHDAAQAVRALDAGAQVVVFPHVDTPEQARQLAEGCRFAPVGNRSVSYVSPHTAFHSMPLAEIMEGLNRETLVVAMLETEQAIEHADAIADVDGIDVLMVGTQDLAISLGLPGQVGNPTVRQAVEKVGRACARAGKHAGVGGAYDPVLLGDFVRSGAQFLQTGNDMALLMEAGRSRAQSVRREAARQPSAS
jgi:2-keto-3-deoxy-L-rhamnonate aldolase RhmA